MGARIEQINASVDYFLPHTFADDLLSSRLIRCKLKRVDLGSLAPRNSTDDINGEIQGWRFPQHLFDPPLLLRILHPVNFGRLGADQRCHLRARSLDGLAGNATLAMQARWDFRTRRQGTAPSP